MNLHLFDIIYLSTNILGVYVLFKMMSIFFEREDTDKKIEIFSYLIYYILTSTIYLVTKTPIVMIVTNLLLFFLLTYNYKAKTSKRIVAKILIYLFLACIETFVVFMVGYIKTPIWSRNQVDSIFGLIAVKFISYIFAVGMSKFREIKTNLIIPASYWLGIIIIPIASLFLLIIIPSSAQLSQASLVLIISIIFLINFVVFYLYDTIIGVLTDNTMKIFFEQQSKYYEKQFDLIRSNIVTTNKLKHDIKNHVLMLTSLYEDGNIESSKEYCNEILSTLETTHEYISSSNTIVNSIVNFKLKEASTHNTEITAEANIPQKIGISNFDLTTILGNLFDNAVTGLKTIQKNRKLIFKINYSKGRLIIQISNTFDGHVKEIKGQIYTTKKDKKHHGIGINSIKDILEKYNGEMDIEYTKELFTVTILIYTNKKI